MKILAVHSFLGDNEKTKSAVDAWRIYRPLRELAKHVDWQIDHQRAFIKDIEKYKNSQEFTESELQKAFDFVCDYDVVFSSYHANPSAYTMLKVAADRAGVQFVMDVDDDMFAINPDNPFWAKMDDEKCYWMQRMIRDNTWISTTTEGLAERFRERRPDRSADSVFLNPNFITDEYKQVEVDNGDGIVIGYFGGSSHFRDLHETGVAEAVRRLMIENKSIRFKAVGMPLGKYVPRARYEFIDGERGRGWIERIHPNLKMDIALAPLDNNLFNKGKSNIKWMESTRAGACFVASHFGPYENLPEGCAFTVPENTEDAWYEVLKKLVDNPELRRQAVSNAKAEIKTNWRLEDNWKQYRDMFLKVKEYKDANHKAGPKSIILQA